MFILKIILRIPSVCNYSDNQHYNTNSTGLLPNYKVGWSLQITSFDSSKGYFDLCPFELLTLDYHSCLDQSQDNAFKGERQAGSIPYRLLGHSLIHSHKRSATTKAIPIPLYLSAMVNRDRHPSCLSKLRKTRSVPWKIYHFTNVTHVV